MGFRAVQIGAQHGVSDVGVGLLEAGRQVHARIAMPIGDLVQRAVGRAGPIGQVVFGWRLKTAPIVFERFHSDSCSVCNHLCQYLLLHLRIVAGPAMHTMRAW
jgi:hypothetical protein